jgi:Tol biopolymer transport system component
VFAQIGLANGQSSAPIGVFDGQSDVGSVTPPGTLAYDPAAHIYTITSAGDNLWSNVDGFHFAWKKMSGDVSLTADMTFPVTTGNPNMHRKTVLIFRQTLDADSAYVDASQHGNGMTSLQFRTAKGATTRDIELNIDAPKRVRIEKRGDTYTLFLSDKGEPLHESGAATKLHLEEPFYVGIGVCSHNKDVVEKATFANVELKQLAAPAEGKPALYSTLQTVETNDDFTRAIVIRTVLGHMEAPNWTRDGKTLIYDQDGQIWRIGAEGGEPEKIDTGSAIKCTGSHGLSPDGKLLAISCATADKPETRVYIIPSGGGVPKLITANPNSYWHGWSPDGKTLLFVRPDKGKLIIYAIPAEGGEEKALTPLDGVNDDPDYSPDGKYIYFNSNRAGGTMQIWRMKPDGSEPEQMTSDEMNNWTPHPSPDGKSILILSYPKDVTGHPANKDVTLRILSPTDRTIRLLVNIVGGSGTDNVPDWAPDSKHVAFVSYQLLPEEDSGTAH